MYAGVASVQLLKDRREIDIAANDSAQVGLQVHQVGFHGSTQPHSRQGAEMFRHCNRAILAHSVINPPRSNQLSLTVLAKAAKHLAHLCCRVKILRISSGFDSIAEETASLLDLVNIRQNLS